MSEEQPAQQQEPEIVQRVKRFAGQTLRTARNPNITARECIELANWLVANTSPQPAQQEPVAPKCGAIIEVFGHDWRLDYMSLPVGKHKLYTQQYTYTTPQPAQRTWVGLTQDEFRDFASTFEYGTGGLIRAIEAKLKEKNNG